MDLSRLPKAPSAGRRVSSPAVSCSLLLSPAVSCSLLLSPAQGWFTCAFSIRTTSGILPRQGAGPAFPSAGAGDRQGQLTGTHDQLLSQLLQVVRMQGVGGGHHFCTHATAQQTNVTASFPMLSPLGPTYLCPTPTRDQFCSPAQARYRTLSPECCTW